MNIDTLTLVTSPEASAFYEKMGATIIDFVRSKIDPGRLIPKLQYKLN